MPMADKPFDKMVYKKQLGVAVLYEGLGIMDSIVIHPGADMSSLAHQYLGDSFSVTENECHVTYTRKGS